MTERCEVYWQLDEEWRAAEQDNSAVLTGEAQQRLYKLQVHAANCPECTAWWDEQKTWIENGEAK